MWEGKKSQASSLEFIILDGAKQILGVLLRPSTWQFEETWP